MESNVSLALEAQSGQNQVTARSATQIKSAQSELNSSLTEKSTVSTAGNSQKMSTTLKSTKLKANESTQPPP